MITNWKDLTATQQLALMAHSREEGGVWVRASMLRALKGDGNKAIYLSLLLFWASTDAAEENDGWFYLTTTKVCNDLGLSPDRQERCRDQLKKDGILEVNRQEKNYYRLDLEAVVDLLVDGEARDRAARQKRRANSQRNAEKTAQTLRRKSVTEKVLNESGGKSVTSDGESPEGVQEFSPHIVKKEEETGVQEERKLPSSTGAKPTANDKIFVRPDAYQSLVDGIVSTYPKDYSGAPVTKGQAIHALNKWGLVPRDASDEQVWAAKQKLSELVRGIKNMKKSVEVGDVDPKYVPAFRNFAGLKILFGEEPPFVAMAAKTFEEPKKVVQRTTKLVV